jgi:hypothetical protein
MTADIDPGLVERSTKTTNEIIQGVVRGGVGLTEAKTKATIQAVAIINGGVFGIFPSKRSRALEQKISEEIL